MSEQNGLLNFIATTVESLRGQMESMREEMVTKDDLAQLETRMVNRMDTSRDELGGRIDSVEERMATKLDLEQLERRMATKIDLEQLELRMDTKVTIIRGDIEQVQIRLDSIDHALSARMGTIETEISRLRSVVYLLVKDQPKMLRLLGQPWPGEHWPQT